MSKKTILIFLFLITFSCKKNDCIYLETRFKTNFNSKEIKYIDAEARDKDLIIFKKKLTILIKGSFENKDNFFLIEDLLCSNFSYKFIIYTNKGSKVYFLDNIKHKKNKLGQFIVDELYSYRLNNKTYYNHQVFFN